MNHRIPLTLAFALLVLSGCSIQFSTGKEQDGGVFRSNDFGESWQQRVFIRQEGKKTFHIGNTDITEIVTSPFDPKEITVTTAANGVFRSVDSGDTWAALSASAGNYPTFAYDQTNSALQYTATGRSILKTANSGESWETIYTEPRGEAITALTVDHSNGSIIYASTTSGAILKSVNFGNDWALQHTIGDNVRRLYIRSDNPSTLFALTSNRGIFRSTDSGASWQELKELTKFRGAAQTYQLATSRNFPNILFVSTNYGLLQSSDGGDTWQELSTLVPRSTLPIRTVAVDPFSPDRIYFSVNNLVHKSEDGGKTWRTIENTQTGRTIVRMVAHPTEEGVLFTGTFVIKK